MANHPRLLGYLFLAGLFLVRTNALGQLIALPEGLPVSRDGLDLILSFEVGDSTGSYYNRYLIHPEWPGAASGVTFGIGWDAGYNSREVLLSDWAILNGPEYRLQNACGITGLKAKAILPDYRDIKVPYAAATAVFGSVTLARFYGLAKRTYPGLDKLRANAQWALTSLIFNRGSDLTGSRRSEMRAIKPLVASKDYQGISDQLLSMRRIWRGTDVGAGLIRRREAEANLVLQP